jgi:hypothetical protein
MSKSKPNAPVKPSVTSLPSNLARPLPANALAANALQASVAGAISPVAVSPIAMDVSSAGTDEVEIVADLVVSKTEQVPSSTSPEAGLSSASRTEENV